MFGLDELKQTRYFREVAEEAALQGWKKGYLEGKLEGKLESVPRLLQLGLTVEQIATALGLDVELVTAAKASKTIQNKESEN
jgi:predicted transposase/invertase (TIGR01784 family)